VAHANVWVSSVRDVLFGRKGNGLGIYLRMSGVVALGSLLAQVTHTESGPASVVGGQGHLTLGQTGGISRSNARESGSPVCSHVGPSSMYDARQLGLPSRDGQGIGLVRRTGVLTSGKYYGRHLKKFKLQYLRGGSSDSDLVRVRF